MNKSMLMDKCLEQALDWDNTEAIVEGCVEMVCAEKDAQIEQLKQLVAELVEWIRDEIGDTYYDPESPTEKLLRRARETTR